MLWQRVREITHFSQNMRSCYDDLELRQECAKSIEFSEREMCGSFESRNTTALK